MRWNYRASVGSRRNGDIKSGRFLLFAVVCLLNLALLLLTTAARADGNLKPFTSDGCSAFPDGTLEQNQLWLSCCVQHDLEYWQGGSYQARLASDRALEACVSQVGEEEIAILMLAGVRVGGTPFLPTSFRWGYGWPFWRGYLPWGYHELDEAELEAIVFEKTKLEKRKVKSIRSRTIKGAVSLEPSSNTVGK